MRTDKFSESEPVVITGIGLIAANGASREEVWTATRAGRTGIRPVREDDPELPTHLNLAAPVTTELAFPGQLKTIRMAQIAAQEALDDAGVDFAQVDRERFGCAVSGHVGDYAWWASRYQEDPADIGFHDEQWLPNSACWALAHQYGLHGPRMSHSTACASGLIDVLSAARCIRDGGCDIALAGGSEMIDSLFAAGFRRMRVLAEGSDPHAGCMPFDIRRKGFVMGEGASMFVMERLNHALARGAKIYAEIVCGRMLADAHHVTSLDMESSVLKRLIEESLRSADLAPRDVQYICAHGTGTEQNDLLEATGIRKAFGRWADDLNVSSLKSTLGHLVSASGNVELAITVLAMRDGWVPPTLGLHQPDPECDLDCVPLVARTNRFQHAIKLALAFGGHFVATVLRRWNDVETGYAYPEEPLRRAA